MIGCANRFQEYRRDAVFERAVAMGKLDLETVARFDRLIQGLDMVLLRDMIMSAVWRRDHA